jgi:bifunctional non-homologous end joining protein LigD
MARHPPSNGLRYALKKHDGWCLHYDLRLEFNDTLLSWVLPVGPSCFVGVTRKAIEMEDHRIENILFEGLHRTGTIMVWDKGIWIAQPDSEDILGSLERGTLRFTLYGERISGAWILFRKDPTKRGYRSDWIFRKEEDSFAARPGDPCVLRRWPNSVLRPGRSLEEIKRDWTHPARQLATQSSLF